MSTCSRMRWVTADGGGERSSSDLSHDVWTVICRIYATSGLVPVEGANDRAVDVALGKGKVQAA